MAHVDCWDPLVWLLKARRARARGWHQLEGLEVLASHAYTLRKPRSNAHHGRRHDMPSCRARPAGATATIPGPGVESKSQSHPEWVTLARQKEEEQSTGPSHRLRMDILFRSLDDKFDGTNIQFLHRRTAPTSVELVFFHAEGMASLIGVGLRFAVVELDGHGQWPGLDASHVTVRECSERSWKELWMDDTSSRSSGSGYTPLFLQLFHGSGREVKAHHDGVATFVDSRPRMCSCGSMRDLLSCILRHGGAMCEPEELAADGDQADHTSSPGAAGTSVGSPPGDATKANNNNLEPEKWRGSGKGKASQDVISSAGDAEAAAPGPSPPQYLPVDLLFKTVHGCDTTSVSVLRNPPGPRAGSGNPSASRRSTRRNKLQLAHWLPMPWHRGKSKSPRGLSSPSDSLSSSARTTTTSPAYAHQAMTTLEELDAVEDAVDDGAWLPAVPADPRDHPELDKCYLKPHLRVAFRRPNRLSIRMAATFEVPPTGVRVAHDNLLVSLDCADENAVQLETAAVEGTREEAATSSSMSAAESGLAGSAEATLGFAGSAAKVGVTADRRVTHGTTVDHIRYVQLMPLNNFRVDREELGNRVAFRATHQPPFLGAFKPAPDRGGAQWAGSFANADMACSGAYTIVYDSGFRDYTVQLERELYVASDSHIRKKGKQLFLKRLKINHAFAKLVSSHPAGPSSSASDDAYGIEWNLYTGGNEEQARRFVREAERGEERRRFLSHTTDTEVERDIPVETLRKMVQDERLATAHADDDDQDGHVDLDASRQVLAAQVLEIKRHHKVQGSLNRLPRSRDQPAADASTSYSPSSSHG